MTKIFTDWKFLLGFILANMLLYFTYDNIKVFWYIYTGVMLLLIAYAITHEELDDELPLGQYLLYGIASGLVLYGIFWLGNLIIDSLNLNYFGKQVTKLYKDLSPKVIWHYILLVLIIVPGEEFFWRGFIQKRISRYTNFWTSIGISSILFAIVQIYTGSTLLMIAALVSGLVWGYLYAKKKSLPLVIISHLTFDLLLLVFFPLV